MAGRVVFVHNALSHPCTFNPIVAAGLIKSQNPNPTTSTVSYEVQNAVGSAYRYLCAVVPSASYNHIGNGWTRVTVPVRDEPALVAHLREFYPLTCKRVV